MKRIDLQNTDDHLGITPRSKKELKAAFMDMLEGTTVEKERAEMLESILTKSNVQFASVADKVTVEFSKFVKLVLTHNLEELLREEQVLREQGSLKARSYIVVSSDLLTDISNCDKNEDDPEDSVNVLSGIYLFGILSGLILSIIAALVIQYVNFPLSTRDLLFLLAGSLVLLLLPAVFFLLEPYLRGLQRKHNELFQRMVSFFRK